MNIFTLGGLGLENEQHAGPERLACGCMFAQGMPRGCHVAAPVEQSPYPYSGAPQGVVVLR